MAKKYTVRYERDEDGWWVASVVEAKGVHTQGRSIEAARKRIKEAMEAAGLKGELSGEAIVISGELKKRLKETKAKQEKAREVSEAAALMLRHIVYELVEREKLSVRDAAEVVGVSHQRIQQLVSHKN